MVEIKELQRNVHEFRMGYEAGWEQWFLLASDHHFDNPKADRKLIKKHLDECRERNALALFFGDTYCLMQGKGDRRGSKNDILPQHNQANYIDAVIDEGIDFFGKYADVIALMGDGNHETSILKFHETNPIERTVQGINSKFNPEKKLYKGGYSGYVKFSFFKKNSGGGRISKKLWYFHGNGGGGAVTKGIIQSQRRSAFVADADIVVSGHVHEDVTSKWGKISLSQSGKIEQWMQEHIILPTYKEEYVDGFGGWHVERGAAPKPLGGKWIRFYYKNEQIHYELIDAK